MEATQEVINQLKDLANPIILKTYTRFGIPIDHALGIRIPTIRLLGKQIGIHHRLSLELWESDIHEAKILAALIADPKKITEDQMEGWVAQINSWAVCDNTCHLFAQTPLAYEKALEWVTREEEFVKRAGFVLMATLAVHDKKAPDQKLASFLPYLEKHAWDERNFVKKAVNWALRQIGKRSLFLHTLAVQCAWDIKKQGTKSAKWIANDALRELSSQAVTNRLNNIFKPMA